MSLKSPYEIIIEEAHEFIPQGMRSPLKTLLTRFALRGRKRGIGVIMASQRSSKIEKDLLTQANILLLHHVEHGKAMDAYEVSSWTGNAESTFKNEPPLELIRRGIMSRMGTPRTGYRYASTLKNFLLTEFPGADQQALIERVLSWCR